MPIVVDPSFAPPAPPSTVTSPDGRLTAVLDASHAGVSLRANFADTVLRTNIVPNPSAETTWSTWHGGRATPSWVTGPLAADGSGYVKMTSTGVAGSHYAYGDAFPVAVGKAYTVQAMVATDVDGPDVWVAIQWYDAADAYITISQGDRSAGSSSAMQLRSATGTCPAGAVTGKVIIFSEVADAGGVFYFDAVCLEQTDTVLPYFDGDTLPAGESYAQVRWTGAANLSTSELYLPEVPADQVRFYRGSQLVRSGDPASAPGGVAVAYDHEAPWGVASSWTAVPIEVDGTVGAATEPAALMVAEDLSLVDDLWVKSLSEPSLSLRATVVELPGVSSSGRAEYSSVPGAALPVVSWDLHSGYTFTLRCLTETAEQRAAMEAVVDSGTLLLQTPTAVDLDDLFVITGDVSWAWVNDSRDPAREWTIAVTQVNRPSAVGAPLRIPGRTSDDVLSTYSTCATLLAQVPSCHSLLGF